MKIEKYKPFIFTEDPDKLVKFYTEALNMNIVRKLEYDDDYGYALELYEGGPAIWLARHSEVKGYSKDKYRHILNLYVDSVQAWVNKVREYEGVVVEAEPFHGEEVNPEERRYVATIFDPEGNCIQFMGGK